MNLTVLFQIRVGYRLAHGEEEKGSRVPIAPCLWASKQDSGIITVNTTKPLPSSTLVFCPLREKSNSPGVQTIALLEEQSPSHHATSFCCMNCQLHCTPNYIPALTKSLPAPGTRPLTTLCWASATKWSSSCWSTAPCPSQPFRTSPPSKSRRSTKATRSGKPSETGKISSWSMNSWGKMPLPSKSELWRLFFHLQESGWKGVGGEQPGGGVRRGSKITLLPGPVSPPPFCPPGLQSTAAAGKDEGLISARWRCLHVGPWCAHAGTYRRHSHPGKEWGREGTYRKLRGRSCSPPTSPALPQEADSSI